MEGSRVEIFPSSLTLPGGSEQSQFVLVSIPHETGVVTVLGEGGGRREEGEDGRDKGGRRRGEWQWKEGATRECFIS